MSLPTKERRSECEHKLIYSLLVAGKSASFANYKMQSLSLYVEKGEMLFDALRRLIASNALEETLRKARTGNYGKMSRAIRHLVETPFDFETCKPWDLERIPGIGKKTSRFFIMWIRPNEKYAALDVHILRWLRSLGYDAPDSTPTGSKMYAEWEQVFLQEAKQHGKTPRELDLEVWSVASSAPNVAERAPLPVEFRKGRPVHRIEDATRVLPKGMME